MTQITDLPQASTPLADDDIILVIQEGIAKQVAQAQVGDQSEITPDELPIATDSQVGAVKVDGTTITIDPAGTITSHTTVTGATISGSPTTGNLTKFSSATAITNGNLTGDVTTSGSLATTVASLAGTTISGTTGSGNVVFSTSPALVTPNLGTPSTIVLTNATGTAASLTAGHVTVIPTLTGDIQNTGNATTITGIQSTAVGGTTGSGNVVFSTSPVLQTPNLGTPSTIVLTNATGTAASLTAGLVSTINGLIAEGSNITITGSGTSGSPYTIESTGGGTYAFADLTSGTNTSATMTVGSGATVTSSGSGVINATTAPVSGVSGLGTGIATFLATPSSANLAAAMTNETGSGALVFSTSPTLVTPALGTPSALVGTNITGTASGLTAGNVTTNANLTGPITSSGNATSIAAQTGTGTTFVMNTSPTLVTPALGTPSALVGTNITGTASGLTAGHVTNGVYTTDTGTVTNTMIATGVDAGKISGSATELSGIDFSTGSQAAILFQDAGSGIGFAGGTSAIAFVGTGNYIGSALPNGSTFSLSAVNSTSSVVTDFVTLTSTTSGPTCVITSASLVTPNIGVATGTSLAASGVLSTGTNSGTNGQLTFNGSTSGSCVVKTAAAAGTGTIFQLPADNGTNTYVLQTNGSGITSWVPASGGGGGIGGSTGSIDGGLIIADGTGGTTVTSVPGITYDTGVLVFDPDLVNGIGGKSSGAGDSFSLMAWDTNASTYTSLLSTVTAAEPYMTLNRTTLINMGISGVQGGQIVFDGDDFSDSMSFQSQGGAINFVASDSNITFAGGGAYISFGGVNNVITSEYQDGATYSLSAVNTTNSASTNFITLTSNNSGPTCDIDSSVTVGGNTIATTNSNLSVFAATTSAQLAGVISDETGSGALVFATSPALVTPDLGTPTALVGTNITGTASGLTSGTATVASTVSSANEAADTTCFPLFITASGTQSLQPKNNTSLTFNSNTGALGATSFSGAGTGLTGTAASLTAGSVTTNANLTGVITSSGNATSIASQTGTGTKFVVDNTPTLITPVLGVATATSVNKMAITAPATSSTLAIADGKTFTASNTITLTGTDTVSANVSNLKVRTIGFSASTPVTGQQGSYVVFPVAGTITGWSIVGDAGTATVRVWKIASGTAAPTVANNINTSGVALATGTAIISSTITDFTSTTVSANDIFAFEITAVATATKLMFELQITVT